MTVQLNSLVPQIPSLVDITLMGVKHLTIAEIMIQRWFRLKLRESVQQYGYIL